MSAKKAAPYQKGKLSFGLAEKTSLEGAATPKPKAFRPLFKLFVAVFLLAGLASVWLASWQVLRKQALGRGGLAAGMLAAQAEDALLTSNAVQLRLDLKAVSQMPGVVSALVVDSEGKVAAATQADLVGRRFAAEGEGYQEEEGYAWREVFHAVGEQVDVRKDIRSAIQPGAKVGRVYVSLDLLSQDQSLQDFLLSWAGLQTGALILFILACLIAWKLRFTRLAKDLRDEYRRKEVVDLLKESNEEVLHVTVVKRDDLG